MNLLHRLRLRRALPHRLAVQLAHRELPSILGRSRPREEDRTHHRVVAVMTQGAHQEEVGLQASGHHQATGLLRIAEAEPQVAVGAVAQMAVGVDTRVDGTRQSCVDCTVFQGPSRSTLQVTPCTPSSSTT